MPIVKVVQLNFAFDPGCVSPDELLDRYHTLTGWSDALTAARASVRVVQAFSGDAQRRRNGVEYVFCRAGAGPLLLDEGIRLAVLAGDPDIVHVNGLDAPLQTWWMRRALPSGVALVVQDHASIPARADSIKAPIRRRAMAAPDGFLFTAAEQADPWIAAGFIGGPHLVHAVLEASTTLTPVDRGKARALTGLTGSPALVWVGRLTANKDPLCVLDGFEQALTHLPDATLTMVFDDCTLVDAVRERVSGSRALDERVRLIGAVPHADVGTYFSAADVFVLGSHREGSGYAAIEACACGAVPVVSDIPSFRVVTGHGAVGALWSVGDAHSFASALVRIGSGNLERHRDRVRAHFEQHLSWAAVGARAMSVYSTVLERRRTAGSR